MPRKQPFPPPLTHHQASGQARARWRGRDYYFGRHGEPGTLEAYRRWCATLTATGHPPAPGGAAATVTVRSVVALWLAQEAPRYSGRGGERRRYAAAVRPLLALFGSLPASELDAERLEQLQLAMASGSWTSAEARARQEARGQPVGWCRNVVNRQVVRLRTIWRWAERRRLVPPGSWAGLCAVRGLMPNDERVRHTARPKAATWEDVVAVCRQSWPAPRAMVLLQWFSGMRPGEVRIMRPCDVDRTGDVWVYRPARHKNDWRGQERAVPLGPVCQKVLAPWLARAKGPTAYLFAPQRLRPRAGVKGPACYTCGHYSQVVRRAARRAGVVGFVAYLCRHAAKQRITQALGLDAARSALGQRSILTTDGYGEAVDLESAKEAARRLG